MAYDVEQLINLQNQIGNEPVMPDALDRYAAMQNIGQQGGLPSIMLAGGGQPSIDAQVQNLASKGRYGDTMLMHVNPSELRGLAGLTINPETGLPEAFLPALWAALPFLAKAMVIGAGVGAGRRAIMGKKAGSWIQNLLGGAAAGATVGGLVGPTGLGLMGASAAGPTTTALGSAAASGASGAGIAATPIQQAALMSSQLGGAGAVGSPVVFGAPNIITGVEGMGAGTGAAQSSPAWMEKIFTSAPWKSIEAHPYRTAATLGGVAAMLPSEQTYGDEYDLTSAAPSVSGFGPFIPKEPRELREQSYTQAEIEEGGPYNFYSKEGGLLSVINRQAGGGAGYNPFGTPTYAQGLTTNPDAMMQIAGGVGDPRYAKKLSLSDWNAAYGPNAVGSRDDGGGEAVPVVENPFQFPTVTPFQSSVSDFDLESSLSRIGGEPYAIPSVPVVESFPTTDYSAVNLPAIDDLYARAAAKIDDPIVSIVAEELNKNSGGLVELAVGGVPNVFEGRVQGVGDGMADQVPFNVIPQTREDIPKTPDMALLSSDEYVVPADVVSMLGNGSSTAGAQSLDKFNQLMRRKAHGTKRQQRELDAGKELTRLT